MSNKPTTAEPVEFGVARKILESVFSMEGRAYSSHLSNVAAIIHAAHEAERNATKELMRCYRNLVCDLHSSEDHKQTLENCTESACKAYFETVDDYHAATGSK